MKKLIVFIAFLFATVAAFSQDLITTRAGEDINAKVVEVGTDHVRYRKASNPDGPVFILPVSDILIIRYENGDKTVFEQKTMRQATGEITPGMKYQDYKDLYNPKVYHPQVGDPYSRGWAGAASFFIPGLGQGIDGEWLRGLAFFGGSVACNVLAFSTAHYETSQGYTRVEFTGISAFTALAALGINIWGIVDAVQVAKIKNMYFQDLGDRRAMVDVKVEPFLASALTGPARTQPVAGLSLRLTF